MAVVLNHTSLAAQLLELCSLSWFSGNNCILGGVRGLLEEARRVGSFSAYIILGKQVDYQLVEAHWHPEIAVQGS